MCIYIYSSDVTRAVIYQKSVLYQSTKHRAELKLSRHLSTCIVSNLFSDLSLAFFANWKGNFRISEPESSNRRTRQRFVKMQAP